MTPATLTDIKLTKGKRHPLQITFLNGGSPARWLEMVNLKGMGDLRFVVNELGRFPHLIDKLVPDYVVSAPGTPAYLRRGFELTTLVSNKAPAKPTATLASQHDKVVNYYQLVGINDYKWQPCGPDMRLASWQYLSFDPAEKKTDAKGDRYRPITLPAGMENWMSPDFDNAKAGWKSGQAPFGQNNGKLTALRDHCGNPHCQCEVTPNTLWAKEVLLIRGKFTHRPPQRMAGTSSASARRGRDGRRGGIASAIIPPSFGPYR